MNLIEPTDELTDIQFNLSPQEINEALPNLTRDELLTLHTECIASAARQLEIASKVLHQLVTG